MTTLTVKFFVLPVNAGDGSAYVKLFRTREKAKEYEEQNEEGWAESCISEVRLTINAETCEIVGSNKTLE